MWHFLKGKKTYALALIAIVYAVYSVHVGQMDWNTAMEYIFSALGGAGIRHGVSTAM